MINQLRNQKPTHQRLIVTTNQGANNMTAPLIGYLEDLSDEVETND